MWTPHLYKRFSYRSVCLCASVVSLLSNVLSSLALNVYCLYASFGVMLGKNTDIFSPRFKVSRPCFCGLGVMIHQVISAKTQKGISNYKFICLSGKFEGIFNLSFINELYNKRYIKITMPTKLIVYFEGMAYRYQF